MPFFSLLEDLLINREQALTNWCDEVQQAAWRALDQAIEKIGESPTALKAAVKARSILGGKLKVIFDPIQKEVIQ
ncbi:MAG TPA: hypothetical protein PLT26_14000 [Anaerolineaceae bacterium]|nr:hypothetical protein [Anaerolineaceae bacterium]